MSLGLVGKKLGMTRLYNEAGAAVPVTVLEVLANRITQIKSLDQDGYQAIQVTTGTRRAGRVNKPMAGIYTKSNVQPGRGLWEFRLDNEPTDEMKVGSELKADLFSVGQKVDVQGTSIGKGYAGVVKRHGFKGGRASHGNSLNHRTGGSIGQCQDPGRVFKGKKMSGHMGNVTRTQQNLEVVQVDSDRNLILIKGAVPGAKGSNVFIRPAKKVKTAN